jgi:serine/threonine protein kinase/tetratricopeptide (TPR) repeat protein
LLAEGSKLGKYELAKRLAITQMSEVWVAVDSTDNRTLALKVVRKSEDNEALVKAAEFGAELQKRVDDPRVVRVHEYGTIGEFLFIDMEFIQGTDIEKLLKTQKTLRTETAMKVALEVCRTLVALDGFKANIGGREIQSAVHGDLKPSNIRIVGDLSGDFSVRILDFGTAKGLSMASPGGTRTPAFTPEYASPELLKFREMNQQSDRWALGVTLYQMLMGRLPFGDGPSAEKIESAILDATAPPSVNGAPPALGHIIGRLLHPDITKRYRTARELQSDLEIYPAVPETNGYQGETRKVTDDGGTTGYRGETVRAPAGVEGASGSNRVVAKVTQPKSHGISFGVTGRLFVTALLVVFISWAVLENQQWTAAKQLESDLKTGSIDVDDALKQYTQLQARRFTVLPHNLRIPELIAKDFINRGDMILFRFQYEAVKTGDFTGARALYQKAQQVSPDSDGLRGRLVLCDAHIDRMRVGQTEDIVKTEEIARKYDEAARLLPNSPDPLLGKALLYLYVARNPERGEEFLKQASSRNYSFTTSVRWVHLLAQTYIQRAHMLEADAKKLEQVLPGQAIDRLNTAIAHVDRAIYWYSQFPTQGNALNEIKSSRRYIERLNEKLTYMQAVPK